MLASASLKISIWTLSRPSVRVMICRSLCAHSTAPRSRTRISRPSRTATIVSSICSQVLVLVERAHHVLGAALREGPAGDVDVLLAQPVDDVLDRRARCAAAAPRRARTWISSSRPPRTRTAATPLIGSSARLTCSSAMRRSRRSPASPSKRPRRGRRGSAPSPGSSEGSKRRISGRSASSGRKTRSSFSRMSWIASDISVSQANSRTTSLTPARLTLRDPAQAADHPQRLLDGPA